MLLKFGLILTISISGSGLETKMYAFLNEFQAIFWPNLRKFQTPAKTLKLVCVGGKPPCVRSLGELGLILLRFFGFLEVTPIQRVTSSFTFSFN